MTLAGGGSCCISRSGSCCGCTPGPRAPPPTPCAAAAIPRCSCGSSSGRPPRWPHGQNPFFSTALFHPTGINLLAQTSVTGLSLPLVPVTWIWGPVASLNVASTIDARAHRLHRVRRDPALGPLDAGRLRRRPALRLLALRPVEPGVRPPDDGGAHAAAAHPGRPRRDPDPPAPRRAVGRRPARPPPVRGSSSSPPSCWPSSPSSSSSASSRWWSPRWSPIRDGVRARLPHAATALAVGLGWARSSWPGRSGSRSRARPHLSGLVWPNVGVIGGFIPSSFVTTGVPAAAQRLPRARRVRGCPAGLGGVPGVELPGRHGGGPGGLLAGPAAVVLRRSPSSLCVAFSLGERHGPVGAGVDLHPDPGGRERASSNASWPSAILAAAVILADHPRPLHRAVPDWRRRARRAGRDRGRARADGRHLRRAPALRHAGRSRCPAGTARSPRPCPRGGPAVRTRRPFSGLQSGHGLAGVNRMHYSQAGSGGPQGVAQPRPVPAKAGSEVLEQLHFGVGMPEPAGTPAAVRRRAPGARGVAGQHRRDRHRPRRRPAVRGHDPTYAAAFMTAALGRPPTIEAGAWVWNDVQLGHARPLVVDPGTLATCTSRPRTRAGDRGSSGRTCRALTASTGSRRTLPEVAWYQIGAPAKDGPTGGLGHGAAQSRGCRPADRAMERGTCWVRQRGVRGVLGTGRFVVAAHLWCQSGAVHHALRRPQ